MVKYLAVGMAGGVAIGLLIAFLGMYGLAILRGIAPFC